MGFKELNDLDKNGLNDVSQPKKESEFNLADSNEVAGKLEQDRLTVDPETKRTPAGRDADTSFEREKIPDSLEGNGVLDSEERQKPEVVKKILQESVETVSPVFDNDISQDKINSLPEPNREPALNTAIDSKVAEVERERLPDYVADTFANGEYKTVVATEDITLYRTFGGKADAGGAYATTEPSTSEDKTRQDLALLPEWGNSCQYEAQITVPAGTVFNIGKAEEQFDTADGSIYRGGGDQVLLPQDWFEKHPEWISDIYVLKENDHE